MAGRSPTQSTLKKLRDDGWAQVAVVERFNPHAGPHGVRVDLFGIGDVLAIRPGRTLLVQATSFSNRTSRIRKTRLEPATRDVLEAGWELEVWGWRKNKSNRWEVTVEVIGLEFEKGTG